MTQTVQAALQLTPEEWEIYRPYLTRQISEAHDIGRRYDYDPADVEAVASLLADDSYELISIVNRGIRDRVLECAIIDMADKSEEEAETIGAIVDKYLKYAFPYEARMGPQGRRNT